MKPASTLGLSVAAHVMIVGAALSTGACVDQGGGTNISARRAALSDERGDLSATLLWNENVVKGSDVDVFSVRTIVPPAQVYAVTDPASGVHLLADLWPGMYPTSVHAFGCVDRLVEDTFPVTANAVTSVNFGLDLVAGRVTGAIELNGATMPPGASVQVNRKCTSFFCGGIPCQWSYTSYQTTLGALMGKLLPSEGPMEVTVSSAGSSGSFTLNLPPAVTTDLGVIHAASGKLDGRVLWNGAPALGAAVQTLTVTGMEIVAAFRRPSGVVHPATTGNFTFGWVPPGTYDAEVSGVHCVRDEGSGLFGGQLSGVSDGQTSPIDVDISERAGRVSGSFFHPDGSHVRLNLTRDGGDCESIESNVDGSLQAFLSPGGYDASITQILTGATFGPIHIDVTAGEATDLGEVFLSAALPGLGEACSSDTECDSGHCADGVCCDDACGGNDTLDCQACSVAAGAAEDGTCGPRTPGLSCGAPPTMCEEAGVCVGDLMCRGPLALASCANSTVPACTAAPCPSVSLAGGGGSAIDHMTVQFGPPLGAGDMSVKPCDAVAEPTDGYRIVHNTSDDLACLDIEVSESVSYSGGITVCVYYTNAMLDDGMAGTFDESKFELYHFHGNVWLKVTTVKVPGENKLCGLVTSLSPFAIVMPADTTPPVFAGVPAGPIVAYAAGAAGTQVSYTPPTAVDAADGPVAVTCTPAPGATFSLGTTPVSCSAADAAGNVATAPLNVWVKVQAPTDGTFFGPPINSDGSSIFKRNSTIPVKFGLTGASAGITNLVAHIYAAKVSNGVTGTFVEADTNVAADGGNTFRYAGGQYIYNLSTKSLATGTWSLKVDLGDGAPRSVNVSLR